MGIFALILGMLGGLSAVMGIMVTIDFAPPIPAEFSWSWWFSLAVVLFLASIASLPVQARSD